LASALVTWVNWGARPGTTTREFGDGTPSANTRLYMRQKVPGRFCFFDEGVGASVSARCRDGGLCQLAQGLGTAVCVRVEADLERVARLNLPGLAAEFLRDRAFLAPQKSWTMRWAFRARMEDRGPRGGWDGDAQLFGMFPRARDDCEADAYRDPVSLVSFSPDAPPSWTGRPSWRARRGDSKPTSKGRMGGRAAGVGRPHPGAPRAVPWATTWGDGP